jgi:pyruvate/2-oxoglutarate dehydrogenase complex dihydrolipoamide dehydrogenase (E3) component
MDYAGSQFDAEWRSLVFPPDHVNPEPRRRYHLVVIGAGPAGLVISIAAAGLGAQVALVEKTAMGGDCLNVGCVPSKALLEFTAAAQGLADFDAAFAHLRAVRAAIAHHDSVARYTSAGVDVFLGSARFVAARASGVDGPTRYGRRFVIATGSRAALPPIPGLADARPLTNETLFDLKSRPARLAILGAGAIGCEMAQAFARLGSSVNLIERFDRVLPGEATKASPVVANALATAGVTLHLGATVEAVEHSGARVRIRTDTETLNADRILVAAGRRANTDDLNLAAAKVDLDDSGLISVDDKLRTTNARIFAAGDVCSPRQLTHNADAQARVVVQNALFSATASTRRHIVPHCTYTSPEVAQVGPLDSELESRNVAFDRYWVEYADIDRGRAQGDADGFAEVLTEKGGDKILAATIVGRDAGEQIAAICIAMSNGLGLGRLAKTILPYPTRAEFLRRLADTYNRGRLTPTIARAISAWFKWTS